MAATTMQHPINISDGERTTLQFLLWIDGVGCWLMHPASRFTIGGPVNEGFNGSDLRLLADLSRKHAAIVRSGERYLLEATGNVHVQDRYVADSMPLSDGAEILLGRSVRLRFRQPSPLSGTGILQFKSDHRPVRRIDGIVLFENTCLLGPAGDAHISCPLWEETVVLYRRGQEFCCKSRMPLLVDGQEAGSGVPLSSGSVVAAPDVRFRIEAIPAGSL